MLNTPSGILSGHLCPPARLSCCRDLPECRSQTQGAGLHASVPQPLQSFPIDTSFRRTSPGSVSTTGLGPSTFLYQNHNKNMKFRSRASWLSHIPFLRNRLCHTLALAASGVGGVGAMPPAQSREGAERVPLRTQVLLRLSRIVSEGSRLSPRSGSDFGHQGCEGDGKMASTIEWSSLVVKAPEPASAAKYKTKRIMHAVNAIRECGAA